MNDTSHLHDRALGDLLASERQIRLSLEEERQHLTHLLTRLAREVDGQRFEKARRSDPSIPKYWTAGDWQRFFAIPRPTHQEMAATWDGMKPDSSAGAPDEQNPDTLAAEMRLLRAEMRQLLAALSKFAPSPTQTQAAELVAAPPVPSPHRQNARPPAKKKADARAEKAPAPETPAANPAQNASSGAGLLNGFLVPEAPIKYRKAVGLGAGWSQPVWRRAAMILYLLAKTGWNAHVELDLHIALAEGISFRSNSTKKPVHKLAEAGMITVETLELSRSESSTSRTERFCLWVFRLTESGRELCQAMGWQPAESEWERLLRLHQGEKQTEHALAVMYFAMLARARGYTVTVMPEAAAGKTPPDVRVQRDKEDRLVEVELGERDETAKWRNLHESQGFAALCAVLPSGRERLVADCKLAKIPGVATDLLTLKKTLLHEAADQPLWVETWK